LDLEKVLDFGLTDTPANSILWDDENVLEAYKKSKPEEVIICDSESMRVFDINKGKMSDCIKVVKNSGYEDVELARAKRTFNQKLIANAIGNHIVCWDTREFSGKPAYKIENAHLAPITDIDFNPNKPYACCTGGEDLNIRFWDIRKGNNFLCSFEEDSHWVLGVKYNRYHDQLVLSSSSSTYASLWRASS
jgi:WD40 repeat protein